MDPVPVQPRRTDGRRERTSKAISSAASTLFYDQGVARTTIEAAEVEPVATAYAAKFLWATWTATIGLTMRTDHMAIGPAELETTLAIARNILARGMGYTGDTASLGQTPHN